LRVTDDRKDRSFTRTEALRFLKAAETHRLYALRSVGVAASAQTPTAAARLCAALDPFVPNPAARFQASTSLRRHSSEVGHVGSNTRDLGRVSPTKCIPGLDDYNDPQSGPQG
jgi:hypothetical protein